MNESSSTFLSCCWCYLPAAERVWAVLRDKNLPRLHRYWAEEVVLCEECGRHNGTKGKVHSVHETKDDAEAEAKRLTPVFS